MVDVQKELGCWLLVCRRGGGRERGRMAGKSVRAPPHTRACRGRDNDTFGVSAEEEDKKKRLSKKAGQKRERGDDTRRKAQ